MNPFNLFQSVQLALLATGLMQTDQGRKWRTLARSHVPEPRSCANAAPHWRR